MGTVLTVTSGTIATLHREAARAQPAEACGLLLGRAGEGSGAGEAIVAAIPCANVAPDPLRHFELDPAALIAAHRAARAGGPSVLGYWHSHPTGHPLPSATDCEHAGGDGRVWAIVTENAIGWFRDTPEGFTVLPTRLVEG
ncbi:MAG: M67 family metallopeptidase [Sphingomonadales bacterium]|nr:M67 family metallopeptidase [Sphingomonadales bacterium]